MTRTPYTEREHVIATWCTCPKNDDGKRERKAVNITDVFGDVHLAWYYPTNPECLIHGDNAEPSPF